ncbi:hypothetical protein QGN23_12670 [Chryseobacterium gotjawalense]|uniref:Uncharacterized protein n=1 Tax=Chryseobacterium gotjawalense TaxID=3042315 RepID=A0ABY8RBD3_9FLAO|nr:hypothetical protein [Chryseobacterium sp. wdc7]WHF51275.1 hypothetical protein QGN23_12670 [Chryseobacterium sp. wdc7]
MKKTIKLLLPSMALALTLLFTLLPSQMEAKGFGLEESYGPCLETSPGNYERAIYEDVYIFWIKIQHEATGGWASC